MLTSKDRVLDALQYVRSVGLSDIADILLIAFLIYKVIRTVKRTNLLWAARGIITLAFAMWISVFLKLNVVNFLLKWVVQLGLMALAIIFQPELRRILENVGTSRLRSLLWGPVEVDGIQSAIAQTAIALSSMKKSKTGALVIFERNNSLDNSMSTGTLLDAEVSAELIKSVFFPKSPLHDGALIIRRDARLGAAGCILPLSSNNGLSRELGMRHRAGIGLSEQSDAIAVILSEETGEISTALEGRLKRRIAVEKLEEFLRDELINEEEYSGYNRKKQK